MCVHIIMKSTYVIMNSTCDSHVYFYFFKCDTTESESDMDVEEAPAKISDRPEVASDWLPDMPPRRFIVDLKVIGGQLLVVTRKVFIALFVALLVSFRQLLLGA